MAVTVDELPPPFAEDAKSESKMQPVTDDFQHAAAIDSVRSTATVITVRDHVTTSGSSS